jgi:rubredoxin
MHGCSLFYSDVKDQQTKEKKSEQTRKTEVEVLKEGMECPNCHFAKLKREGSELVCPVCGYGYRPCT